MHSSPVSRTRACAGDSGWGAGRSIPGGAADTRGAVTGLRASGVTEGHSTSDLHELDVSPGTHSLVAQLAARLVEEVRTARARPRKGRRPDAGLDSVDKQRIIAFAENEIVRIALSNPLGARVSVEAVRWQGNAWAAFVIAVSAAPLPLASPEEMATLFMLRLHDLFVGYVRGSRRVAQPTGASIPHPRAAVTSKIDRFSANEMLMVRMEAVRVDWRGCALPLSPSEARVLGALVRLGAASWDELGQALGGRGCAQAARRVHIHRINRKLEEAGVPLIVRSQYGRGLIIEPRTETSDAAAGAANGLRRAA